jgi:inhibitor of KinA
MINIAGTKELTLYPVSENALTIEFGNSIEEGLMAQVSAFDRLLKENPFPGLYQTVPAYATLTVFFDPVTVINQNQLPGKTCYDKVCEYLRLLSAELKPSSVAQTGERISIPVCYGGALGPDLDYVASCHQLTTAGVVALHSDAIYKVYMIGFIPGFAYMGGLNSLLETPRKTTPARAVAAGAVGIAGKQTGIYPLETPGGWQIIGQTPVQLFNAARPQPSLLKAGDIVKFEPISFSDFGKYSKV